VLLRRSLLAERVAFVLGLATIAAACGDVRAVPIRAFSGGGNGGGAGSGGNGSPGTGGNGGTGGSGPSEPCPDKMMGYATVAPVTIGGGDLDAVTVGTLAELEDAAGQIDTPAVIRVMGMIDLTGSVDVESDKTIFGADGNSGLRGGGLDLTDSHNIIIRNLRIEKPVGVDAIEILRAHHVWIDHCDLSSDRVQLEGHYDGLVDITRASDFVTVSWTKFHDHLNASLVGHREDNGAEDIGHLTVTYHHNLFQRINGAIPRVRFGKVHLFNNHYEDVTAYAIASQMGAEVLIENNVFQNVAIPITTQHNVPPEEPGKVNAPGNNLFQMSGAAQVTMTTSWRPTAYPQPDLDSVESLPKLVSECAGVGKVTN
jgi:pectate lyase